MTESTTEDDPEQYQYVVPKEELDDGERVIVEAKGREVAVVNSNGTFYAVGNHCPHMGGPTCQGLLSGTFDTDEDGEVVYGRENEIISCPWHGWEFDVTNGEHLGGTKKRLLTYRVVEIDGDLYLDI